MLKPFRASVRNYMETYGDRAFSVCAPKIWSIIPLEIRQSSTVLSFKKKRKTFLFIRFIESNSLYV